MTTTNHKTREEAQDALRFLQGLMSHAQLAPIGAGMRTEERQHLFDKVVEMEG